MSFPITLQVNASTVQRDMAPSRLLIDFLRDDLGLTGTHQGCDTSQCGACTVLVDGKAVKSCNVLVVQVNGSHIRTVEGLATSQGLHPMQEAFGKHHGLQCGYCTPGMVMRALAMVNEDVPAEEVRRASNPACKPKSKCARMNSFDYRRATSAAQATAWLREDPDAKLLAGGQSLLAAIKLRLAAPSLLIDLQGMPELQAIREDGQGVWIGAMCTHASGRLLGCGCAGDGWSHLYRPA